MIIGYYIEEIEQQGAEWATYGDHLLSSIAKEIKQKGCPISDLLRYRQFFLTYPNILATVSQGFLKAIENHQFITHKTPVCITKIKFPQIITF